MTTAEFALPDAGEGLTEAEIVSWRVAVGESVTVNQVLVEIETAKSLVELPSPFAGVVTAILVTEGQTVPVGTPITITGAAARSSSRRSCCRAAWTQPVCCKGSMGRPCWWKWRRGRNPRAATRTTRSSLIWPLPISADCSARIARCCR